MTTTHVKESIAQVVEHLTEHPEDEPHTDAPATAVIEEGLRVRVEDPNGFTIMTDMPEAVGGGGTSPSPGWFARAALASCDATVVAMRAAQLGIQLTTLEVFVESDSDTRGFLGVDDSVPPGPLAMRTRFRLGADGVSADRLEELVEWTQRHSPVGDATCRAVQNDIDVEILE